MYEIQYPIAELIEASEESQEIVQAVLKLFERYPEQDFGVPGPLVHAIERYPARGYEEQLLASLERTPTRLTLWLANRVINAGALNRQRFMDVFRSTSESTDLHSSTVEAARGYLRFQAAG